MVYHFILRWLTSFLSCASSAISPSGERVAVANLSDGVDFYSTSSRSYMSTVRFTVWHGNKNPVSDVVFIDEDHVGLGHADGSIRILTFGSDRYITASVGEHSHTPIQQMVSSMYHGVLRHHLTAASGICHLRWQPFISSCVSPPTCYARSSRAIATI